MVGDKTITSAKISPDLEIVVNLYSLFSRGLHCRFNNHPSRICTRLRLSSHAWQLSAGPGVALTIKNGEQASGQRKKKNGKDDSNSVQ